MAIDKQATWFAWQNPNWDGNAITTGGTSTGVGGTSAPSPEEREAEVLAAKIQGRKNTDAYLAQQQQAEKGRGHESYARTNYLNKAVNNGNPVEQITTTELYDRNARSADYDKVQADIAAYKDYMNAADEAEGFKQKAVQNQYGDADGVIAKAERDAAEARKNAEKIADSLKRNYGITTNGLRVDTDAFNTAYFDEALKAAKTAEANKPIDTIGMLTGTSMDYMDASTTDMLKSASEDDKVLYSYLLEQDKKNGTNVAPAFQTWLKDNQARARGAVKAEDIESMDEGLGKVLAYGGRSVGSGLTGALNDVRDSITGEQGARSINEYAAEQLRQGLVDDNRKGAAFFFDAARSVGAMAPGLTAGIINPALGAAVFATTTGASGYQDKLDEGWTQSDAMSYGIATAIAEGGLQYVTGGISKLGNMAPAIKAAVDSIPKPVLRALAGAGVRGSAEFVEEFIQTYLDPAIVSVLQGTAYDTPEFREAFRNGALGFVSSLGLGGGDFINDLRNSQPTQSVDNAPSVEGGEITPPTPQKAEQTASGELNSQATPNAKVIKSNVGQNALLEAAGAIAPRAGSMAFSVQPPVQQSVNKLAPPFLSTAPTPPNVPTTPTTSNAPSPATTATSSAPPKTVPTQSRFLEQLFNEDERQIEGLTKEDFTHEQRHDSAVNAEADQRINMEGVTRVQAELNNKPADQWNDADVVTAQKLLSNEVNEARSLDGEAAAKAYAEIAKLAKAYRESGTEQGRAMRQRRSFDNSVAGITALAAETLYGENVSTRKKLKPQRKSEIMNQVADLATRYNNIAQGDVDGIISMIKEVNEIRGTTGLFSKETNKTMSWALEQAKAFPDGEQFLSEVLSTQIKSIAGDYVTPSVSDSVKSYRFLSMLSKISTVARNLVSNSVLDGMERFSNNITVPLDILLSQFTGTRSTTLERGMLLSNTKRKGTTEGMVRSMIQVGLDADLSDAPTKYDQRAGRNFKMTGNFLERFLSTWEKYENYALRTTDEAAKGGIAAEKQRGIDALLAAGKVQEGALSERAKNVALERTLQSDTAASKVALGLRNAGNVVHVGNIGAGDLLMPFARIPANAVSMSAAYTPAGVVSSAAKFVNVLKAAKGGTLTADQQAEFVQSFGRALTGAGLTTVSAFLGLAGVIKAVDDEDKDKAAAEKSAGQNGVQINLDAFSRMLNGKSADWQAGDNLLNVGFLQPINANLMMGLALADAYKDGEEITLEKAANANAEALAKSVLEFPAVYQIKNMADNFKYSGKENIGGKIGDAALGFAGDVAGSFIPNALRGIAAGTDPYIRDIYSGETPVEQAVDNIKAGIPGLRETLPVATDSWGNPKTQKATPMLNFLNQNILPGAVNVYQPNAMMPELERLTEAGITGLYPNRSAPSKISDAELSYEDKQQYLKTANSLENKLYNEAVNSGFYKGLTDEQKGEWLKDIQSYAEAVADTAFRESKGIKTDEPSDVEKLENPAEFLLAKSVLSDAKSGKENVSYNIIDAMIGTYDPNTGTLVGGTLDSDAAELLDSKGLYLDKLMFAATKSVNSEQWFTDHAAVKAAQKSLGDSDLTTAIAIMKSVDGDDATKLRALEAQMLPEDGGKRNATVRRFEAATKAGISFNDWATLEATVKKADTNTSFDKKSLNAAMDNLHAQGILTGLNANTAYDIYKKHPNDETKVDVYDEKYGEANPVEEKDSGRYIDFIFGINN